LNETFKKYAFDMKKIDSMFPKKKPKRNIYHKHTPSIQIIIHTCLYVWQRVHMYTLCPKWLFCAVLL